MVGGDTIKPQAQTEINKKDKSIGAQLLEAAQIIGEILYLIGFMFYSVAECIYQCFVPVKPVSVKDEIVLITGTGHGIGKELALLYASQGATVVGWDVNSKSNAVTEKEIAAFGYKNKAHFYECDITKREAVLNLAKKVQSDVGDVSILINNAGIMPAHSLFDHTEEEILKIMNVNVLAHFWTLQAFLPTMIKKNHGHIVALSSCAGIIGCKNLVPYCASKFAVRGIIAGLNEDLAMYDNCQIKTTVICPYMVDTGLCKKPKIRFEKVMPLLKQKDVANEIMTAQRTGVVEKTIPANLLWVAMYFNLFPAKVGRYVSKMLNSGVESDL